MIKPGDFENVQAFSDFKALPAGGYVCKVMKVEEATSSSGKPMIIVSLDIAEGEYKDYYSELYRSDSRIDKKWGCRVFQLVYDGDNKTSRGFKTFCTAVKESNSGFEIAWGDNFANCFKGKLIGGVFRREEYEKTSGGTGWTTRCCGFRGIDSVKKGIEPPQDKPLLNKPSGGSDAFSTAGFENLAVSEDDLPF